MKYNPISFAALILFVLFCGYSQAQSYGTVASAVWITDCNQSNFYNTSGSSTNLIGPSGNVFENMNLGAHTQNSGSLILRGAQVKTFKNPASSSVCSVQMFYRVFAQSTVPGSFNSIHLPFFEDCNVPGSSFPSGGPCVAGDQKWQRVIANGVTTPYAPVNLTGYAPGNYVLEVYYDASGSNTSTSLCNELVTLNNSGNNYKAFFSIQSPTISGTNPSSCLGSEGSITIGGLVPAVSYQLSYLDDGSTVGPGVYVANGAGQVIVTGLNKGFYSSFALQVNGCTTNLFTGLFLSDPIFVPTFTAITPFCAGTTPPILPTTSNNGMTGIWNPAIVDNQASGNYTFTPNADQCGFAVSISVSVTPRTIPTFSFGTSSIICAGATVPNLPLTSTNGITGSWSPSIVDNQNSGTYTFTAGAGQCATGTTFTVTSTPNITPAFSFGTSSTVCAGAAVPTLATTSTNGIMGTWSPSVVDNQNSDIYTFTPNTGQCGTSTSLTLTVTPNIATTFNFGASLSICSGATVPVLPDLSGNGIAGSWSPSVIDNQNSGNYIFTPDAGVCATAFSFTVTAIPNIIPTFSFGTSLVICTGAAVPTLPATSLNSITGTWSPAVVDNQNSGTYTFTPTAGQCATTTTFTVTVATNILPAFGFGTSSTICAGAAVPTLTGISSNGITGSWSPSLIDNLISGSYTFTPNAGQCAVTATFVVTVSSNITPVFSFGTNSAICAGAAVPALATVSTNGISGTWNPSVINNQNSGVYTFTPAAGECATTTTLTMTVSPIVTPTFSFGTSSTICAGAVVPALPSTSTNSITGTWSPSVIDNQNTNTYTFTPDAGLCATTTTLVVNVGSNFLPTFSFGTSSIICSGRSVPTLPTTSANSITGTWNPSVIDNQNSATYTFTPTAGQCATATNFVVTVNATTTPTFNFGTSLSICADEGVPILPATSNDAVTGSWNPSVVSNQTTGIYTFTPTSGSCGTPVTFTVTVTPNITPTFGFGTNSTICAGTASPTLPASSTNGITGIWSPSVIDNLNSAIYTFTPNAGSCATRTTFTVTVNANVTPTFSIGASLTICSGAPVPLLPTTSTNGITGTWNTTVIDNQNSGTYTFTPNAAQCVTPPVTTFTVTVTANALPVFSFANNLTICAGETVPVLPTTSTNGISGTWTPSVVSSQTSGTYLFSGATGACVTPFTYTVNINPVIKPVFSFGTIQSVCIGSTVPVLPAVSTNGITGTWILPVVDNKVNGKYIFTPAIGQCADTTSLTYLVNGLPTIGVIANITVNDGAVLPVSGFNVTPGAGTIWTNSNSSIGLPASGTGNIPSFIAVNKTSEPVTATITVTPVINGCTGTSQRFVITVMPLNKDIFVPNVFSPNRDGRNDMLLVYGNYIDKLEMRIFNQWGQQIALVNSRTQGWDGTHKGSPQPVGVYVYVLRAVLSDGKIVDLKGSFTLIR